MTMDKVERARESEAIAMMVAAENGDHPRVYPVTDLARLLRDQVVTVLMCEAEPHVIADAIGIVQQAADRMAALEPLAESGREADLKTCRSNVYLLQTSMQEMVDALRQWKCPACGGTREFKQAYSQAHPEGITGECRKCANSEGLHPIAFAALAAKSALSEGKDCKGEADCPYCGGSGEYFGHSPECTEDLCALAGGMNDCDGQAFTCNCDGTLSASTPKADQIDGEAA